MSNKIEISKLSDSELLAYAKKLSMDISKYHNFQLTKKIQLNSAYGAMGNQYFRFYDIRLAEAVTLSGQLVIQWLARDINLYLNNLLKTTNFDYIVAIDTDSLYEAIIYHLISEGYVQSEKQARDIIPHLSEGWFNHIVGTLLISESLIMDVNHLLEEGYDLSSYTWNELYESYTEYLNGILTEDYADTAGIGVDPITGALIGGAALAGKALYKGAKYVVVSSLKKVSYRTGDAGYGWCWCCGITSCVCRRGTQRTNDKRIAVKSNTGRSD